MPTPALFGMLLCFLFACAGSRKGASNAPAEDCFLVVLGVAQDGGYPHAGCRRSCCQQVVESRQTPKLPTCIGLVDRQAGKVFLLEASPAFAEQWRRLQDVAGCPDKRTPDGILLTHAHIGHYTGLMQLGREVMGAKNTPVWAMPRMESFLRNNGPWSQLVSLQNIELRALRADSSIQLTSDLRITPIQVPHRDEFSETVGFRIETPRKKVLFIPDIDKWAKWGHSILEEVKKADIALLDATFFKDGELPNRPMSEVPHPFVQETMQLFEGQPLSIRQKVVFIHFNHTNPLLYQEVARKEVLSKGFLLAEEGMRLGL